MRGCEATMTRPVPDEFSYLRWPCYFVLLCWHVSGVFLTYRPFFFARCEWTLITSNVLHVCVVVCFSCLSCVVFFHSLALCVFFLFASTLASTRFIVSFCFESCWSVLSILHATFLRKNGFVIHEFHAPQQRFCSCFDLGSAVGLVFLRLPKLLRSRQCDALSRRRWHGPSRQPNQVPRLRCTCHKRTHFLRCSTKRRTQLRFML